MITADQLKDIKERTDALKQYLAIDEKIIQVEEEQLRTQAPGFWDNAKEAEAQMKKVKGLQAWIDGYKEVKNRTEEAEMAMELYREEMVEEHEVDDAYARALTAVEELELKNMLRGEADDMDCVLKINSGAGGTEAQDWASMLMRMYMRWPRPTATRLPLPTFRRPRMQVSRLLPLNSRALTHTVTSRVRTAFTVWCA